VRPAAATVAAGLLGAASLAASTVVAAEHAAARSPEVAASTPTPAPTPVVTTTDLESLRGRALVFPVPDVSAETVRSTFGDDRGGRPHEALDVPAPRGARVVAVDDGVVAKLFTSVPGGLTVYVFDDARRFAYYYAHLDGYAEGLVEGRRVGRGDLLGWVGSTGNAAAEAPHLHFAIFKLEESQPRWWIGTPIDPYPLLRPQAGR